MPIKEWNAGSGSTTHFEPVWEDEGASSQPLDSTQIEPISAGLRTALSSPCSSGKNKSQFINSKAPKEIPYYVQDTDNLPKVTEHILNPTRKCIPEYLVKKCNCGYQPIISGCGNSRCLFCNTYFSLKRAKRVMSRLSILSYKSHDSEFWPTMIYTIFTIPAELRYNYYDTESVQKLRLKIWHLLKKFFGATWAIEATHPISEKTPTVFHPHFNFFWQCKNKHESFIDVYLLKKLYWLILHKDNVNLSGTILNVLKRYKSEIDLFHLPDLRSQYSDKPGWLWKKCKYITRSFPEFSDWIGCIRYYGKPPKLPTKGDCICPVCQSRINVIGHLTAEKTAEFLEHDPKSGRPPPIICWADINLFFEI